MSREPPRRGWHGGCSFPSLKQPCIRPRDDTARGTRVSSWGDDGESMRAFVSSLIRFCGAGKTKPRGSARPLPPRGRSRFAALVDAHIGMLEVVARRISGAAAAAADLVQDTLERAWRHLDALQDDGRARAWLVRILRNTWLDQPGVAARRSRSTRLTSQRARRPTSRRGGADHARRSPPRDRAARRAVSNGGGAA